MFHVGQSRVSSVGEITSLWLLVSSLLCRITARTAIVRTGLNSLKTKRKVDRKLLAEIKKQGCCVCGNPSADPAHIRSVGAGGPDEEFNVIGLCRRDHQTQHQVGWKKFSEMHLIIRIELELRGWKFDECGKLWNKKLREKN